MRIGVISDTHGLMRPETLRALQGVDLIVHAGDVGNAEILQTLKQIAPVFAVRGNVDVEPWADELPVTALVEAGDVNLYLIHNLDQLDLKPEASGIQVVISGHTHQVLNRERDGVLYLNPGSAGPRRFSLPTTLMLLERKSRPLWKVEVVYLLAGPFS